MVLKNKTNNNLVLLVKDLKRKAKEENIKLWNRVAKELSKPTKNKREVNLYKIEKFVKEDEIALIPGKVLGVGELSKKVTVAAYSFSEAALKKINKAGKAISIKKLMEINPKGKKVRILG